MEFYSAIKKDNIMSFMGKWMELENIMLSEISQSQKVRNWLSLPNMLKLERIRDIGGTPFQRGEILEE